MLIQDLVEKDLIDPPTWLPSNTCYLTRMGSEAYGVSTDSSDTDMFGVAVPPKRFTMPTGIITGFDQVEKFESWQKHGVIDKTARKEYDFKMYGIVHFFHLLQNNNPDVLDTLFVPRNCIVHITEMFELIRENRKMFLHKGIVHRYKGYAYSQLQKAKNCAKWFTEIKAMEEHYRLANMTYAEAKSVPEELQTCFPYEEYMRLWDIGMKKTQRFEQQKLIGWDTKFLYHVYRLVDEAEYVLVHHDLDLQEPGRKEKMKAIRRGDVSFAHIVEEFSQQEKRLMNLYETSTLQYSPDKEAIRNLLLTCLESHYGSIDKAYKIDDRYEQALIEIKNIYKKYAI